MTIGYTMPMIYFHGRMDWGVFVEWGEMSAVQGALRNGCDDLQINQETGTISGRSFSKSLFSEMTPFILALS